MITPGPWKDGHNVSHRPTVLAERVSYSNKDNGGFIVAEFYGPDARDNARLCSAAPELQAALITASDALEQMARDHALHPYAKHCLDIVANAREAIAKARGEKP